MLALTAVLLGGGTALSPAAAETGEDATSAGRVLANGTVVAPDGEVHYDVDLSGLPGAEVVRESGKSLGNGGCTFQEEGRGHASEPGRVLVSTEVSFDPNTCTREVARADYPRNNLPESVQRKVDAQAPGGVEESASKKTKLTDAQRRSAGAAAGGPWSGSIKVNVEDPPQIDVTTTKSMLTWSTDSAYLYSDHSSEWGWYSPTGWERKEDFYAFINDGNVAWTNTIGKYRNGAFCLTIDTWTHHKETLFEGWYDGSWYWSYEVDKWGGCTALLSYERIVVTP
ncbi:hypothetical protein GCM10009802_15140 [Streptomyces synnematoformans]|uniref:Uncharacterized protein n=2 Tax=Streptomyces synnematoformans TaxID=415721 RepID=A0ABN2XPQ8_9ACTN